MKTLNFKMNFSKEFDDKALEVTLAHLEHIKKTTCLSNDELADFGVQISEFVGEIRDFADNCLKNISSKSHKNEKQLDEKKKQLFEKVTETTHILFLIFKYSSTLVAHF